MTKKMLVFLLAAAAVVGWGIAPLFAFDGPEIRNAEDQIKKAESSVKSQEAQLLLDEATRLLKEAVNSNDRVNAINKARRAQALAIQAFTEEMEVLSRP